jgi:hypothetical protein
LVVSPFKWPRLWRLGLAQVRTPFATGRRSFDFFNIPLIHSLGKFTQYLELKYTFGYLDKPAPWPNLDCLFASTLSNHNSMKRWHFAETTIFYASSIRIILLNPRHQAGILFVPGK